MLGEHTTFGQKIAAGLTVTAVFAVVIGIVAVFALRTVVERKDRVITVNAPLLNDAQQLRVDLERKGSAVRGYLLTGEEALLQEMREARADFLTTLERLRQNAPTDDGRRMLEDDTRLEDELQQAVDRVVALRKTEPSADALGRAFADQVLPIRERLDAAIRAFAAREQKLLEDARTASNEAAAAAQAWLIGLVAAAAAFAAVVAIFLARALGRQIGTAVGQVQSSSAELQAAANQQATGAKEQATAMNEITTTISELLATSRQIAESAQRVSQIADQTASAARQGDGTVAKANDAIGSIRRQVDLIVGHMLDLGKKSQQIGSVLEIVAELAEQTNILAINATIEAAGAGETGKRFSVVADEIRKLADRVAGSAKEIRALIDDVRSAVNTTVMATETGSKAVDTGSKLFGDVASALRQVGGLVTTTTEAGREIELSTKQQATAVEQVNVAIANVAQASKETEASSGQTLQTASQLAILSKDLLRLVQSGERA
jgi:methyl-accepting chemotaxis protein